jgi:hypothetical protein
MMKLERVQVAKIPPFYRFSEKVYEDIGTAVVAGIQDGIKRGLRANGTPMHANAEVTKKRKERLQHLFGGFVRSLIDIEHRFIRRGAFHIKPEKDSVEVSLAESATNDISVSLQGRGYTGWFGVYPKAAKAIRSLVRDEIISIFKSGK